LFSPETTAFLESGCALIVATVSVDGEPRATRGWGLDVLGENQVRILLEADDHVTLEHLASHDSIAITSTSVRTLHSMQLKGRALRIEPATDDDRRRAARFCDDFFSDIVAIDGYDRALLDRLVPADYVTCTVAVEAAYDQTPGPRAGASFAPGTV
jgi:Pyridoxamine 5'-phosphate oxidase